MHPKNTYDIYQEDAINVGYKQGPIKPRMDQGPDVHSGPYSKSSRKFKYL